METTRIEQTRGEYCFALKQSCARKRIKVFEHLNEIKSNISYITEIVREYGGIDAAGGILPNYPAMSSRYADSARDTHHQQSSSAYSQRRNMHDYDCCFVCLLFFFFFFFLFLLCIISNIYSILSAI